jgi:cardiolipin synthase
MRIRLAALTVLLMLVLAGAVVATSFATTDHAMAPSALKRSALRSTAVASQSNVSLIAEPQAGVRPFLALIAGAQSSIELTMYELTDPSVEQALGAAARRGVDTRVLLNGGYYSEHESTNQSAYDDLAAHGVHVRYTPTYFALTHQKTLTVDGRESAVMTLNFDGLYPSTRDYAILDSQPADVRAIVATFNADWSAHTIQPSTGTGDLLWSPGAEAKVLTLINGAHTSIDLENEEMADTYATDALCDAAKRGVDVRIVMTYASDWRSAFDTLTTCGAHVRVYHGQTYYIHAKLLVIDQRRGLISSQNLSVTSLQYNRELGIELTSPTVLSALRRDFGADYTGAAPWSS